MFGRICRRGVEVPDSRSIKGSDNAGTNRLYGTTIGTNDGRIHQYQNTHGGTSSSTVGQKEQ
jgi:hypothetical protein